MNLQEGASQVILPQGAYYRVQWRRDRDQPLPSGIYQNGNALQISNARPDQSGTYFCELYGADGTPVTVPYEIRVRPGDRPPLTGGKFKPSAVHVYELRNSLSLPGGPPRISIEPKTIKLKEGQRMIVQYTVSVSPSAQESDRAGDERVSVRVVTRSHRSDLE